MKNNTMSIFAQALIDNTEYKNARINGVAVGVANARLWANTVKAVRIPAYAVRVYRFNNMGNSDTVAPCDQTALYNALKPMLELVGEVNGAKLDAFNVAEEIISNAMRFRVIDITPEMAHARNEMRIAKKAMNEDENEETIAEFEKWNEEVKRLEGEPGNCKRIPEIASETAFVKAVETLLGNAITKQQAKSAEEVAAEEEAKRAARRAKTAAKRAAKKAEKNAK